MRRHHLGQVDAVLGVGVAVIAVLLSVWLVAAVITSPNSRFTSLDAAVARSDILHSIDRILPQAPSIFNDLQTFLNNQGFPQVFSTLTPPSTPPVSPPTDAQTRALADPAIFSTVKVLGTACDNEQEGSAFVVGPGLVATNAHVVAGEANGKHAGARRQQRVQRDDRLFRPVLRPRHLAHQRADGTGAHASARTWSRAGPRPRSSATPRTDRSPSTRPG